MIKFTQTDWRELFFTAGSLFKNKVSTISNFAEPIISEYKGYGLS